MRATCLHTALPTLLLLLPAVLAADDPKPEAILDKALEAAGGRAAFEKIKTEVMTGTLELTGMGMKGDLTIYRALPDKSYTVIEFSGMGKAEEGVNGGVAWALNGMQGARIKEGDERAIALRNAALHAETHWQDFFTKAELAGTEDVDGKPCYKLILTPKEGSPETRYYDKSSNLLVKVVLPTSSPDGPLTVEVGLSDYRDEGGTLVPHTITQKVPTTDIVIKIDSVKRNEEIPDSRFDLPAEVKALAAKK